jgi:integrase
MARANRSGVRGLYKDADGRHRIDLRWTDPKSGAPGRYKEILPLGTTAGAAKLRATAILSAALAGTLAKRGTEAPTRLKSAFEEYRKLCGTGNAKQKERHCKELLAAFGDVSLSDVTELSIERFKRTRGAAKAPGTVNRELATLRHFFTCAIDWHWTDTRPKIRMLKESPGRVRWLSDAERARLYAELPVRFKRVVLAAALCGQRLGNIVALTRDRVDVQNRTLSIPKTKSGKRHDVPISEALAAVIAEAIADGDAQAKRREVEPPVHVFLSRLGRPYTSSGVSGFFRKCVEVAGVTDFHFHDLRHDFATRVRRAGHGLDVVQDLLGHATPAMTQRYAHIGADELHRAVASVGAVFAPVLPPSAASLAQRQPKTSVKKRR